MLIITGAAGFIGSNLARELAAMGYALWLVDHPLTPAKAANFVGLQQFTFLDHDALLRRLDTGLPPCEGVFHLGACSRTTETDWQVLYTNNVLYSQALWTWCARHQCPFLYASSAATYGDGTHGFDDRTPPAQLRPQSLYAKSKNLFDQWVLEELASGRPVPPRWAGLKFFNVYGPHEAHKGPMASMIWQAYDQLIRTGEVMLFRSTDPAYLDGEQQRDFVFVADCIAHLLWLWQHLHDGGLFNSGTGSPRTFKDVVRAVGHALQRPPRIRYIDMPIALRPQYQNCTRADMSRLRHAGCTHPPTSLEAGVQQLIAVYRA
jgi:ADP-L-glycero-D-manno-heptose 6-epimerase